MSIKQLDEFVERQGIKSAELCKIIDNIESQLKQKDEEVNKILKFCLPYHEMMWASKIMGFLLDCDFRESGIKAKEWLEKNKGEI